MAVIITDQEIDRFLRESKILSTDYRTKIQIRSKRGHKERDLDVTGSKGSDFRLILRQSLLNPLDFSIILVYIPPNSNQLFRLRRYNGKSHEHSNLIEGERFYNFHIHQATERYQTLGAREDSYAESTDRFSDFYEAISCMLTDCGFEVPSDPQRTLFEEI